MATEAETPEVDEKISALEERFKTLAEERAPQKAFDELTKEVEGLTAKLKERDEAAEKSNLEFEDRLKDLQARLPKEDERTKEADSQTVAEFLFESFHDAETGRMKEDAKMRVDLPDATQDYVEAAAEAARHKALTGETRNKADIPGLNSVAPGPGKPVIQHGLLGNVYEDDPVMTFSMPFAAAGPKVDLGHLDGSTFTIQKVTGAKSVDVTPVGDVTLSNDSITVETFRARADVNRETIDDVINFTSTFQGEIMGRMTATVAAQNATMLDGVTQHGSDFANIAALEIGDVIDLIVTGMPPKRRVGGVIMANTAAYGRLLEMRHDDGTPLVFDPRTGGAVTVRGYPVVENSYMSDETALVFGQWMRGVATATRPGLAEVYTQTVPGKVTFYREFRYGATIYDDRALRALKLADGS